MRRALVTGATGFIGRHVVPALICRGFQVHAVARDPRKIHTMPWRDQVRFTSCDIHDPDLDPAAEFGVPDVLVHLAWPGLPNFQDFSHVEKTLPADFRFIKEMVCSGTGHVLVTGTCFEYGLQEGMLTEETPAAPVTPYGRAKNSLRAQLQSLQKFRQYTLQWIRLFYLYGPGQNPKSLLSQLDAAIERGDDVFDMSGGEQLRDYLLVEEVARRIAVMAIHPEYNGIFNCCSGRPISVRHLVENRIAERHAKIRLNPGFYPYPEYEPMAFWGDGSKMRKILDDD
jgi:nucleoside-diphosphate-sugar epimerase